MKLHVIADRKDATWITKRVLQDVARRRRAIVTLHCRIFFCTHVNRELMAPSSSNTFIVDPNF